MPNQTEATIDNGNNTYSRLEATRAVDLNGTPSYPTGTSRIPTSAATVNATVAKAAAGRVFRMMGSNVKAATVYLKLYNKATAPNPATDAALLLATIPLAASASFDKSIDGLVFPAGISYLFTTDATDTGTTALAAGDILGFTLTYA